MNAYKIKGTSRQVGSIGTPEPFERVVWEENPRMAYNKNRQELYSQNREAVLTMEIQETRVFINKSPFKITVESPTVVNPDLYLY